MARQQASAEEEPDLRWGAPLQGMVLSPSRKEFAAFYMPMKEHGQGHVISISYVDLSEM